MSTQMMKAVQQHAFGGPEVLSYEDAPMPVLQAGEVLVQVHAVGVNPPDSYLRDGYQQLPPEWRPEVRFPLILGTDLSGVVVARADDVREVAVGDEVYAMARFPEGAAGGSRAYAEYVSVPVSDLARKPLTLSHQQAAAVPMSLLTAWQFMIDPGHEVANPLQPGPHRPVPLAGKRVLVNGAAGGVIAAAAGRHEAFLRQLGADSVIDYTTTAVEETVRDLDLVIDAPGGPASGRFLRTLRPGGALYPIFPLGFAGAEEARQRGVTVSTTQVRSSGAQLARLADLLDAGVIRVAIDSVFPLAQAQMAHERAAQGHLEGKIVLLVMDSSAG
ncbi:NADP-dependent oxidoreductase [Klebsiella pneumoniae]|nr:NADP-dependent oxidoreductase [Klebsiella pneumoniae]